MASKSLSSETLFISSVVGLKCELDQLHSCSKSSKSDNNCCSASVNKSARLCFNGLSSIFTSLDQAFRISCLPLPGLSLDAVTGPIFAANLCRISTIHNPPLLISVFIMLWFTLCHLDLENKIHIQSETTPRNT